MAKQSKDKTTCTVPAQRREQHERWLTELTSLPTAAGREGRVIEWVESWAAARKLSVRTDEHGNRLIYLRGAKTARSPLVITAHADHPAFVITEVIDNTTVKAHFRGGVEDRFFMNSPVRAHPAEGKPINGMITEFHPIGEGIGEDQPYRRVAVTLTEKCNRLAAGDVITWRLPDAKITGQKTRTLRAPACDDLAGLAAALACFDELRVAGTLERADVRLLITRAEEVGFIGAIGACSSGIMPVNSRLLALENSKSFTDSPLGGGPIVRVGDKTSTFDPELTYAVGRVAQALQESDAGFSWQRKLMPGGTCEASAYQAFGYTATCLCLPLGNYHNMDDDKQRIGSEFIRIDDFHGLVRLLIACGHSLTDAAGPNNDGVTLRPRLETLFADRRSVLG